MVAVVNLLFCNVSNIKLVTLNAEMCADEMK